LALGAQLGYRPSWLLALMFFKRGVVEKRTTIPILPNALLEFENFQPRLSATDPELGPRTRSKLQNRQ